MKVLKVENLNVTRGREKVIDSLSFSLEKGEFLTVLGPNGSGKSTLLEALLGIVDYEGDISWAPEAEISYLPERLAREMFLLFPLTVKDFFSLNKIGANETGEMLSSVGLSSDFLERNPAHLSSGEFQRMLVAWSLAQEPNVLLFDEPMGGIDVGGKETIYNLLHNFWEKKELTVILVTHEINVVYAYSTNVLCLSRKKMCYGQPKEVLTPENLRKIYGHQLKFYEHT